ncbi:hypothetical protein NL676_021236 [Syzygium grande]|nr:hypothetical protein NL676_021236 [Syzygium grande]
MGIIRIRTTSGVALVARAEGRDELLEVAPGNGLGQAALANDLGEELAAAFELHDEVDLGQTTAVAPGAGGGGAGGGGLNCHHPVSKVGSHWKQRCEAEEPPRP